VTIRECEAALIRDATDRVVAGSTLTAIVRDWTERGWLTTSGRRWTIPSLKRVLVNPRSAGLRHHCGVIVGEAVWPAIVEPQKWSQAVAILEDPNRSMGRQPMRGPLLDVVRCGLCGRLMGAMPSHRPGYRCRGRSCGQMRFPE
jgi:site-specific DNA recombinase